MLIPAIRHVSVVPPQRIENLSFSVSVQHSSEHFFDCPNPLPYYTVLQTRKCAEGMSLVALTHHPFSKLADHNRWMFLFQTLPYDSHHIIQSAIGDWSCNILKTVNITPSFACSNVLLLNALAQILARGAIYFTDGGSTHRSTLLGFVSPLSLELSCPCTYVAVMSYLLFFVAVSVVLHS